MNVLVNLELVDYFHFWITFGLIEEAAYNHWSWYTSDHKYL